MENPIFDFMDETVSTHIFVNMGFDAIFAHGAIWPSEEHDNYVKDFQAWLDAWDPGVPEGYTLIKKYDTEDGPCALIVKPLTRYAKLLLEFGESSSVQEAVRLDREDWTRKRSKSEVC